MLVISSILITLALIFYSIGIWSERFAHYLKNWHVFAFWIGLCFDISGTLCMHYISNRPFDFFEPHTFTGQLALWLMMIHAIWATWVIKKGSEMMHIKFHRYSIFVWSFWLIPYFVGMYLGMSH